MQIQIRINLARIVTIFLVLFNIGIYIFSCFQSVGNSGNFFSTLVHGPDVLTLVRMGAKVNGLIALHQFYRIIIPIFLHANLVHLIFNMLGLWYVGGVFEMSMGKARFLTTFLLSGIVGNIFSFLLIPQLSVGASGALFGLFLFLYVTYKYEDNISQVFSMKPNKRTQAMERLLLANILLNVIGSVLFPFLDWACHLGGALTGAILAFIAVSKHFRAVNLGMKSAFFLRKLFFRVLTILNVWKYWPVVPGIAVCVFFGIHFQKISPHQRIFAASFYEASLKKDTFIPLKDLNIYEGVLKKQFPKATFTNMWELTSQLVTKKQYAAAFPLVMILTDADKNTKLPDDFFNSSLPAKIHGMKEDLVRQKMGNTALSLHQSEEIFQSCRSMGRVYYSMGFYEVAYALYHCAATQKPADTNTVMHMLASKLLIENQTQSNSRFF